MNLTRVTNREGRQILRVKSEIEWSSPYPYKTTYTQKDPFGHFVQSVDKTVLGFKGIGPKILTRSVYRENILEKGLVARTR